MYRDAISDQLRQIERVQGERQLAAQEALIVELRRQNRDITTAQAELELLRNDHGAATKTDNISSLFFNVSGSRVTSPQVLAPV